MIIQSAIFSSPAAVEQIWHVFAASLQTGLGDATSWPLLRYPTQLLYKLRRFTNKVQGTQRLRWVLTSWPLLRYLVSQNVLMN